MANFPDTRISLVLRLNAHADVQAWQEFAEIYTPALRELALCKGLQPADADDVAQDVLFGVARAVERFRPDSTRAKFRTWLGRIARNLIADFFANKSKRPVSQIITDSWLQEQSLDVTAPATTLEDEAAFLHAKRVATFRLAASRVRERVSELNWTVFERATIKSESADQVAEELGISLGNLYVMRCRVMKQLRAEVQALAADGEESTSGGPRDLGRDDLPSRSDEVAEPWGERSHEG